LDLIHGLLCYGCLVTSNNFTYLKQVHIQFGLCLFLNLLHHISSIE